MSVVLHSYIFLLLVRYLTLSKIFKSAPLTIPMACITPQIKFPDALPPLLLGASSAKAALQLCDW